MKKVLKVCVAGVVSISMLGACSFGKREEPRNAALLIGEEHSLKDIANQHKSEIKTNAFYKVKKAESDGKHVLIMDQKTAGKMVEIGVLRESDNDNDVWSSDPIKSLPSVPKGKALLLASNKDKKIKELTINEKKIDVQYASNTWFGHYRNADYEDLIAIVDNSTFNQIPVNESSLGILHFNKSYGEDRPYDSDDMKAVQAETDWKKIVKSMKDQVDVIDAISILKQ
ncbi:lipoprotein BA_5634 family protein [Bacillus cereus]|uniref:lipoprotein BA_5634 family protein n=1 Tax=Bacillus cereus TaxID=1396 RepID=UPI002AC1103B|nr:lipoprotein BA_5634 family protein [Bacillus cereus]MDZ4417347.1 lipoprotein BA_5634 family protein [Bacillus cereus]